MATKQKAQRTEEIVAPSAEHKRMEIFVGKWRTEGEIVDGVGNAERVRAIDTYEWLPGGYFLVHHVDGRMGDDVVKTLEIIGYDAVRAMYFSHAFDNHGNVATYDASLSGRAWSIRGGSERFAGTFSEDGRALTGTWERKADDGEWHHWMTIKLTKVG